LFQVIEIDGAMRKNNDSANLDAVVLQSAQASNRIPFSELSAQSNLRDAFRAWDFADDFVRFWPDVRTSIDAIIASATDAELSRSLGAALRLTYFCKWLLYDLAGDHLPLPTVTAASAERIPITDADDDGGCVWIGIPGATTQFGEGFKNPMLRAKCRPFIDAVRYLDRPALIQLMSDLRQNLEKQFHTASAIIHPLKDVLDRNSRWFLELYFANLSRYPVIVEPDARLVVTDPEGKDFDEPMLMVRLTYQDDRRSIADTQTPCVVPSGGDVRFGLVTRDRQFEMARGLALREVFNSGRGRVSARVRIQRVGLLKHQWLSTLPTPFRRSGR
jgi:hypothetical protein